MIAYRTSTEGIRPEQLAGFFAGWPNPPSRETHLRLLEGSAEIVLAIDTESDEVVGFVNALSDGVLSAYIPLLEVRESHRGRGIGRKLMSRVIARLGPLYMVDLTCDAEMKRFYEGSGFRPATAMMLRDHARQAGRPE
jgi:ribosomal protein S18 acetylase RimI-like enzyme